MAADQPTLTQGGYKLSQFDRDAEKLTQQYESVTFEDVHRDILDLVPSHPIRILDVGAGSGRDSAALAARGHDVWAVEPSDAMRARAKAFHPKTSVKWISDRLPTLEELNDHLMKFDLILVSAVWMYLPPSEREEAMGRLTELLAPSGLLILTLRHGAAAPDRTAYDVPDDEVLLMARQSGLDALRQIDASDALVRSTFRWSTLVFRKPATQQCLAT